MSDMYNNFNNNENEQNNSDSYLNSYGTPSNNDYGTSYSYVSENNNTPKKKKRHIGLKALAVVLSFLIVGGGSIQAYKYFSDKKVSISNYKDESSDNDKRIMKALNPRKRSRLKIMRTRKIFQVL